MTSIERRHPLAECEKCPIASERGAKFVPSVIPEGATVAFIGEAPGKHEVIQGAPFVGPSGKLLEIVMNRVGINKGEVILGNAVACNKADGSITPSQTAIRCCRPRLVAELEDVETIVPMGNSAAQAVFGRQTKITQERIGPSKSGTDIFPDKKIVPTIHPAACLRYSDFFPYLMMDFNKIGDQDEIRWTPPKYKVWDTVEDVQRGLPVLAQHCPTGAPLVIDIETGKEKDDDFTHPSEMLCIGLGWEPNKVVVIERTALKAPVVKNLLVRFFLDRKLICHNGKYDLQVLNNMWGLWDTDRELHLWFDTMLASYALDERRGTNSLDYNGQEVLGSPNWKGMIHRYIDKDDSYAKAPVDVLDEYNAYDVAVTWALFELFSRKLGDLRRVHDMMIGFSNALAYVEKDGIKVDMEWNQKLFDEYQEILAPLEQKLKRWLDNPRSYVQVKEAVAPMLGIPVKEARDRITTTDKDALKRWKALAETRRQDELYEFCSLMQEHRLEQRRFSSYVKGVRKRVSGGRIYPTYLVHGTTSGRLSSRNPNIQNQPRYVILRRQYVVAPGNIYIQGDYSGAENRVVAFESGDEYLTANLDRWNKMVAERLYGRDYTEEQYVRGKAMVHGTNYGREAYSIAMEYNMAVAEAERYHAEYLGMIPGVVAWQDKIAKTILAGKFLETKFGRRRRFWLITKENKKDSIKEGLSFIPQSTVSDINNYALEELVNLSKTKYRGVMGVRIPVHDSILTEWRQDLLDEGAHIVKEVMERNALRYTDEIPFPVEVEYGFNWGDKDEYSFA